MARKKRQTRLTFEPVAASSSPDGRFSPAKVRYSNATGTSSPSRIASPLKQTAARTPSRAKNTQSKLQGSIGISWSFFPFTLHLKLYYCLF
ncbi:hypothetical protein F4821DRAFT_240316 [Hypoxylon rubiginosum]|uniref:Uncharacterized protein n=1 Tax=Hypoxylon rubiginosum TaxID=110542 RepID=A0ACC0CYH2_9PEZI|nr:hypothetical protein F4821DRAFT_240316 [Hypoxylon rubiginosum]